MEFWNEPWSMCVYHTYIQYRCCMLHLNSMQSSTLLVKCTHRIVLYPIAMYDIVWCHIVPYRIICYRTIPYRIILFVFPDKWYLCLDWNMFIWRPFYTSLILCNHHNYCSVWFDAVWMEVMLCDVMWYACDVVSLCTYVCLAMNLARQASFHQVQLLLLNADTVKQS